MANLSMLAWFGINQQDIAQNLCENRFKPELNCHGQCILMKKMKIIRDKQQKEQATERFVPMLLIVLPNLAAIAFAPTDEDAGLRAFPYLNSYCYLFHERLELPPKFHVS